MSTAESEDAEEDVSAVRCSDGVRGVNTVVRARVECELHVVGFGSR